MLAGVEIEYAEIQFSTSNVPTSLPPIHSATAHSNLTNESPGNGTSAVNDTSSGSVNPSVATNKLDSRESSVENKVAEDKTNPDDETEFANTIPPEQVTSLPDYTQHIPYDIFTSPDEDADDIASRLDPPDFDDDYLDYEEQMEFDSELPPLTKPTDFVQVAIPNFGINASVNSDGDDGFRGEVGIRHWSRKLTAVTLSFAALIFIFIVAVLVYACSLIC